MPLTCRCALSCGNGLPTAPLSKVLALTSIFVHRLVEPATGFEIEALQQVLRDVRRDGLLTELALGPLRKAALRELIAEQAPTIDGGRSRVKIPAGAQSGKQLRLRAKGMPQLRGGKFGDLYLELQVETPVNLTSHQKELLQMFEDASKENSPESKDFFTKVRSFWDGMTS